MQGKYLLLIRAEYAFLIVAALLSMNIFTEPPFAIVYAIILLASIAVLLTRALMKPEQDWYGCRALAESIKTLTWRYMMHSAPFEEKGNAHIPRTEFRNHLQELFDSNRTITGKISPEWAADDQITHEMDRIRGLSFTERKQYYLEKRVQEQRTWYAEKASSNTLAGKYWVAAGVAAYIIAGALALGRIQCPQSQFWPIGPILVFAASIIGWTQIKKFNEHSAAYTLTAHEIGLIKPKIESAETELDMSNAVNESELAFSREHTLWIARRKT